MIINGPALLEMSPIKDMVSEKHRKHGVSYGLGEAGYDIRIKQDVLFTPFKRDTHDHWIIAHQIGKGTKIKDGSFCLASAIEEFQMPPSLTGIVHDKSTWARHGLSVFNTVIEPGWHGYLTLELVYHGREELVIPAGAGIAQVIFHQIACPVHYDGKYQNQKDEPVSPIMDNTGPVLIIDDKGVYPENLDRFIS